MVPLALPRRFARLGARELLVFADQGRRPECSQNMRELIHCSGEFGNGDTNHRYLDLLHENELGTEH